MQANPIGNQAWRKATGPSSAFRPRNNKNGLTFRTGVVGLLCATAVLALLITTASRFGSSSSSHQQLTIEQAKNAKMLVAVRAPPTPPKDDADDDKAWGHIPDVNNNDVVVTAPPDEEGAPATTSSPPEQQQHAEGSNQQVSVAPERTFQRLTFGPSGCTTTVIGSTTDDVGSGAVDVEFFLHDVPSPIRRPSSKGSPISGGGGSVVKEPAHIVSFAPRFSNHASRYFPNDSLTSNNVVKSNITLLSDSMRVVATAAMERERDGQQQHVRNELDTRVVCDADEHKAPSRLAWGYDLGGSDGSATVRIAFRESESNHHGESEAQVTFPPKSHMAVYGAASRGAGIRLSADDTIQLKNLDVNHYALDPHANLYGSVPLLYAVDLAHPKKYTFGLLWLNGAPMHISTKKKSTAFASTFGDAVNDVTFKSDGGAGRLYVLPGPTVRDVLVQYFALTGMPMLPPLFGLGYHHCRWSFKDQADVLQVNAKFSEHKIPIDTIWLDIDHTDDRRYFTFNKRIFPDPDRMVEELRSSGRTLITITDPHIKVDKGYSVYREAHMRKFFVSTSKDTDEEFHGHCWSGNSAWIDFANPNARLWYGSQFTALTRKDVFSWIDMNEPSVFSGPELTMPMQAGQSDGVHRYPHREVHNLYGFHHSMATFGGHLLRSDMKQRPFLLTRSFFAGSQRFAAVWTGDNQAQWSHLRGSVSMLMMHSLSGIVFIGADVGGFFDNPSDELHVRWYQLGCLYPFFRGHSHEQTHRREPWLFSQAVQSNIAAAIRFRYELLPYMYALFYSAHSHGLPIWRPRMLEFPDEEYGYLHSDDDESVIVGSALLAVPALHEGQTTTSTTIPAGDSYLDWWSGVVYPAGTRAQFTVHSATASVGDSTASSLPVLPLLIRAGYAVPTLAHPQLAQSSSRSFSEYEQPQHESVNELLLVFALDAQCNAKGYSVHDDGWSTAFATKSEFCVRRFYATTTTTSQPSPSSSPSTTVLTVRQESYGSGCNRSTTTTRDDTPSSYRFMSVAKIRVMTGLCTKVPEDAAFTFVVGPGGVDTMGMGAWPMTQRMGTHSSKVYEAVAVRPATGSSWELSWSISAASHA